MNQALKGVQREKKKLPGLVLVAAGRGDRFGGSVPKQFKLLNGVPVYLASLRKFISVTDRIVIVVPRDWIEPVTDQIRVFLENVTLGTEIEVISGGTTRQESVLKGLRRLEGKCDCVLVHDAVRPFLSRALITRVIKATERYGAAVPLEPVTDTVKVVRGNMIVETLDRSALWRAQTPQGSSLKQLLEASEKAEEEGFAATDESGLLERSGFRVRAVKGEKGNIKITWKEDLNWRNVDET